MSVVFFEAVMKGTYSINEVQNEDRFFGVKPIP